MRISGKVAAGGALKVMSAPMLASVLVLAMAPAAHAGAAPSPASDGAANESVELDSPLGFTAQVAITTPLDPGKTNQIDPSAVTLTVNYVPPGAGAPAVTSAGIYATIEARRKGKDADDSDHEGDTEASYALASFGCGLWGTPPPPTSAPPVTGNSCNAAPMILSGHSVNGATNFPFLITPAVLASGYDLMARVKVVYTTADGRSLSTATRYVAVTYKTVAGVPEPTKPAKDCDVPASTTDSQAAKAQQKCTTVELRSKRFDVMAEYAGGLAPANNQLDPTALAFWVRAAEPAETVAVVAQLGTGSLDNPTPIVTLACAVGSLEAGQTIVYQGQSCNFPSSAVTLAQGAPLFAQFSVAYAENATCWSKWVPVASLTTAGPAPSGLVFARDGRGHAQGGCYDKTPPAGAR